MESPSVVEQRASTADVAALPDLDSRSAIHDAVVAFYREIVFDDLLGPVFTEVAEVDWAEHIPKLIDYWCRVLLGEPGYHGVLLHAHQHVHSLAPFRTEHFERWLDLWAVTIDEHWSGPRATEAKQHAERIGAVLHKRLLEPDLGSSIPDGHTSPNPAVSISPPRQGHGAERSGQR